MGHPEPEGISGLTGNILVATFPACTPHTPTTTEFKSGQGVDSDSKGYLLSDREDKQDFGKTHTGLPVTKADHYSSQGFSYCTPIGRNNSSPTY